jgi:cytochrome P450
MASAPAPTFDADIFADDFVLDPYPHYAAMRAEAGAVYLSSHDLWALPRYKDVRDALRDWQTYTSSQGAVFTDVANNFQSSGNVVLGSDPPRHTELRGPTATRIHAGVMRYLKDEIGEKAEQLIGERTSGGAFDGAELARDFVVKVFGDLLGLPEHIRPRLVPWGEASFDEVGPSPRLALAQAELADRHVLKTLSSDDFAPGSIGDQVYRAVESGESAEDIRFETLWSFIAPGVDTTVGAITTLLWQLAVHPDQWNALRSDRTLMTAACNEALRFDSPQQALSRVTTRDVEVAGVQIPRGARVAILYGSANRDETHYQKADTFDLSRRNHDHVAFGHGIHTCVGAHLARLELETFFNALLDRATSLSAGEPEWYACTSGRRQKTLAVQMS